MSQEKLMKLLERIDSKLDSITKFFSIKVEEPKQKETIQIVNGVRLGAPSLGFEVNDKTGELIEKPDEMKIVDKIFMLRMVKDYSLADISNILNREGDKTKRGGRWYPATVAKIIKHPKHIEKFVSNGEYLPLEKGSKDKPA